MLKGFKLLVRYTQPRIELAQFYFIRLIDFVII